jgi:cyclase
MVAAVGAGASAVLAASIFHERELTVGALKRELTSLGLEVRP